MKWNIFNEEKFETDKIVADWKKIRSVMYSETVKHLK